MARLLPSAGTRLRPVFSLTAISPDSQTIATLTYDNEITIWDAANLRQLQRFSSDTNGIKCIEYMTSDLLAVAGETTSHWNVVTGKLDKQLSPGRYNFSVGWASSTSGGTVGSHNRILNDGTSTYSFDLEGKGTSKTNIATENRIEYSWKHVN